MKNHVERLTELYAHVTDHIGRPIAPAMRSIKGCMELLSVNKEHPAAAVWVIRCGQIARHGYFRKRDCFRAIQTADFTLARALDARKGSA